MKVVKSIAVSDFGAIASSCHISTMTGFDREAVSGDSTSGLDRPMGVDYSQLTPVLVKAIQEQQAQIDALSREVDALKQELEIKRSDSNHSSNDPKKKSTPHTAKPKEND